MAPTRCSQSALVFSKPADGLNSGAIHIGKTAARSVRKEQLEISFDLAFNDVINSCATMKRKDGGGTWITKRMISAYSQLHQMGFAHSVEAGATATSLAACMECRWEPRFSVNPCFIQNRMLLKSLSSLFCSG